MRATTTPPATTTRARRDTCAAMRPLVRVAAVGVERGQCVRAQHYHAQFEWALRINRASRIGGVVVSSVSGSAQAGVFVGAMVGVVVVVVAVLLLLC